MSGYGYNYDNEGQDGHGRGRGHGQYGDGMNMNVNDPYNSQNQNQNQQQHANAHTHTNTHTQHTHDQHQYQYGYHDPYSNEMGNYAQPPESHDHVQGNVSSGYGGYNHSHNHNHNPYGEPDGDHDPLDAHAHVHVHVSEQGGDNIGIGIGNVHNHNHGNDDLGSMGDGEDGSSVSDPVDEEIDFDDPRIANLPRILLMGPRRAGKTSIQRVVFHKMSPHETLFRLEATQNLERSVVDHTPLCRFTIWDFPGEYYGPDISHDAVGNGHGHGHGHVNMNMNMNVNGHPIGIGHHPHSHPHQNTAHVQGPNIRMPMTRQPPVHAIGNNNNHNNGNGHGNGNGNDPSQAMNHLQTNSLGLDNRTNLPNSPIANLNANPNANPNTIINASTGAGAGTIPDATGEGEDGDAQVFGRATALIFVLDAQDEPYDHVLQQFTETVKRAARANPHIAIEVFINKVDGELFLSDEAKYDCRRDVMQQVSDELMDAGVMPDSVQISYHLTSIYDHSIFEAFSRVVQKLIPQLPTLENLLNVLVSTCAMEKAFLFDVASKLYISTDSSPVDMQSVELCSDMIDVVLDVSGIYGLTGGGNGEGDDDDDHDDNKLEGGDLDSSVPGGEILSSASAQPSKNAAGVEVEVNSNAVLGDDVSSVPIDYDDGNDELVGTLISKGATDDVLVGSESIDEEPDTDTAYDSESASVIRLSKGMVLYLKEVDTMLALVCLTRSDNFRKRNLINYNIGCLKKALRALVRPST